jgi:hypothetical protein
VANESEAHEGQTHLGPSSSCVCVSVGLGICGCGYVCVCVLTRHVCACVLLRACVCLCVVVGLFCAVVACFVLFLVTQVMLGGEVWG